MRVAVKPGNFRWTRERAGRAPAELIRRFPKYAEWEAGVARPTLNQLERLARAVRAPIGYFLLAAPLEEPLPIPDFRTVESRPPPRPSLDLLETVYLCQRRQDWYREFVRAEQEEPLAFPGSAKPGDDVGKVAAALRETLGLDLEERSALPTWTAALRQFIRAADALGVLVMVSGIVGSNTRRRLDPGEFRGFALADDRAPLIFINGADSRAAQMFTLAHELAHLWIGQSALSDAAPEALPVHEVEAWCNRVAAELLAPSAAVREEYREGEQLTHALPRLARRFKVSALVILRRLHDLGILTRAAFRNACDAEWERLQSIPNSGGSGGGDFYRTQTARVGDRFARAVVASALEGRASFTESLRLLGFRKAHTFDELARRLGLTR